jgi:hypothetical protein
MESNREVVLRMSEEYYLSIPDEARGYLSTKRIDIEMSDWSELMQDETYSKLYKEKKKVSKDLEQRAYDLREAKRKV